jgi:hypothetical protein
MVVVSKNTLATEVITPSNRESASDFFKALEHYLSRDEKNGDSKRVLVKPPGSGKDPEKIVIKSSSSTHHPKMAHSEEDIKRRRYTVFMADLERTLLYSLSHEAAQHQVPFLAKIQTTSMLCKCICNR